MSRGWYARIPQKGLNLRLGRNTCGRISMRPPQNRNVSGAWRDDERPRASFSAQTCERFAKTTPLSPVRMRAARPQPHGLESQLGLAVPELCQNPICLACRELQFEREQVPQVVDIRHFRMESMEGLEPGHILRNQQVSGSSPEGGSIPSITYLLSLPVVSSTAMPPSDRSAMLSRREYTRRSPPPRSAALPPR